MDVPNKIGQTPLMKVCCPELDGCPQLAMLQPLGRLRTRPMSSVLRADESEEALSMRVACGFLFQAGLGQDAA